MCKDMFKTSGLSVHIIRLVHNFYIKAVAKKVTLSKSTHNKDTANPQTTFNGALTVSSYAVKDFFTTLSTSTTTTIFKIVTIGTMEQKNSSLTINPITIYN